MADRRAPLGWRILNTIRMSLGGSILAVSCWSIYEGEDIRGITTGDYIAAAVGFALSAVFLWRSRALQETVFDIDRILYQSEEGAREDAK